MGIQFTLWVKDWVWSVDLSEMACSLLEALTGWKYMYVVFMSFLS
jgi:hypothetical protein